MANTFSVSLEVLKSTKWSLISDVFVYTSHFLRILLLANFLSPGEFGQAAIVLAWLALPTIINQYGIMEAITGINGVTRSLKYTLFSFIVLLWIIISFVVVNFEFLLPLGDARAIFEQFLALFLISILVSALETMNQGLMQRNLDYRSLAYLKIVRSSLGLVIAAYMVFTGYGVWSLLVPTVVANIFCCMLSFKFLKFCPKFSFSIRSFRKAISFANHSTLSNLANFLSNNGTIFFMTGVWSASVIGHYSFAYRLNSMFLSAFVAQYSGALYPIMTKIRGDKSRFQNVVLELVKLQSLTVVPIFTLLACNIEELIFIVFGDKWELASSLLQILLVAQIVKLLLPPSNNILYSLRRPEISSKIAITRTVLFLVTLFLAFHARADVITVALILVLIEILVLFLYAFFSLRVSKIDFHRYVESIKKGALMSIFIAMVSLCFVHYVPLALKADRYLAVIPSILSFCVLCICFRLFVFKDLLKLQKTLMSFKQT